MSDKPSLAGNEFSQTTATLANGSAIDTGFIDMATVDKYQVSWIASATGLTLETQTKARDDDSALSSSFTYSAGLFFNANYPVRQRYVRFILTNNTGSGVTDVNLEVKTTFGSSDKQTVVPLSLAITDATPAAINRSVVAGKDELGVYQNIAVSNKGQLEVVDNSSRGAFGELLTTFKTPVTTYQGVYNYLPSRRIETFTAAGGTATASNQEYVCTTGTSIGGYGVLRTSKAGVYKPGQGIRAEWTARFPTGGVANSLQFGGLFTSTDGFYIGYSGTTFGCIHEYGGIHEVRTLTISAGASGTESLTIVVDDDSHTFNVTSGTAAFNAYEIAIELNANIAGWNFYQNDDTVIGYKENVGAASGTYSFTNNSAGTCAASWAQNAVGQTTTRDVIAQVDWNGDSLSTTLDPSKGNVYQVTFQYLGYGAIKYFIEDENTDKFVNVHTIKYTNNNSTPSLSNPAMKVGITAASLGSTTDITVASASAAIFVEGINSITEDTRSYEAQKSIGTTETPLITFRNRRIFSSKINQGEAKLLGVIVSNDSSKGASFRIYHNSTLSGTTNYQYIDETQSVIEYDESATGFSNGELISVIPVAGDGNTFINLADWNEEILPDTSITITGKINSGSSSALTASLAWREDI